MESEDQIAQEKLGQRISLEKSILAKSNKEQYQRCCCIIYNIFKRKIKTSPPDPESGEHCVISKIIMDFEGQKYTKLMNKLKCLKLLNLNQFGFRIVKMKNKHALDFIDSSFPNKVNELDTCFSVGMKMNRANYFNSLIRISSKVTRRMRFEYFCLSLSQLKRLVAAYRLVERLDIYNCKLSIPKVPDFSRALENCQIQEINLWSTGSRFYSNWGCHPGEFKNLIQGFSTSPDLRRSLRQVNIMNCEIEIWEAKKIFEKNGLKRVKITGES
ncbi:unnamed protein product [Moneuplotes crassus]|uniref:Uncharacterized protein n=1 Tax=Euplotes crassus TaxID=5936 RepID=A0AAD1X960_EUPCR|nr:unnamed protein product [Moneuplotes crassus]